jgi:hypothetical protein
MAATNATTDEVRVALLPLETSLTDEEVQMRIDYQCELINTLHGKNYTQSTEPTTVRYGIVYMTAYDIIATIFLDQNLSTVRWRWNDVEIEHGQNAFAMRDFANKLYDRGKGYLTRLGLNIKSATHYKEWETKEAGRPSDYYYGEDSIEVE